MYQVYKKASPDYEDKVTVPVLWDKKTEQIVNNESSEIIKMFNKDFDKFATKKYEDIYPQELRKEIDDAIKWIYPNI